MSSRDGSNASAPRFDAVVTAAENRRDNWQRLLAIGQACTAAAEGESSALARLTGEAMVLLAALERLEGFWAYPGVPCSRGSGTGSSAVTSPGSPNRRAG